MILRVMGFQSGGCVFVGFAGEEFECEALSGVDTAGFDVVDFFDLSDEGLPAFE